MPPRPLAQSELFKDLESTPLPQLQQDVQIGLLHQMVQWMQAVALAINKERHDEQDHH
jgi:hypothetical protein